MDKQEIMLSAQACLTPYVGYPDTKKHSMSAEIQIYWASYILFGKLLKL